MERESGLSGQEVEAMTADMDEASRAPDTSESDRAAAGDEMDVRRQQPEDRS